MCERLNNQQLEALKSQVVAEIRKHRSGFMSDLSLYDQGMLHGFIKAVDSIVCKSESVLGLLKEDLVLVIPQQESGVDIFKDERLGEEPGVAV